MSRNYKDILFYEDPIFIAIERNRLDFVEYILSQESINRLVYYQGYSPLSFAIKKNRKEIVKLMLSDKRFLKYQNIKGFNLFEYAISRHYFDTAEVLIVNPDVQILGFKSNLSYFSDYYKTTKVKKNDKIYAWNLFHFLFEVSQLGK